MWGSRAALPAGPGQAGRCGQRQAEGENRPSAPGSTRDAPTGWGHRRPAGPVLPTQVKGAASGGGGVRLLQGRHPLPCPRRPLHAQLGFPPDGFATATQRRSEASLSWRGRFPLPVGKAAPEGADLATVRQSACEVSASHSRSAVIPVSSAASRQSLTSTEAARRNPQPSWGRSGHRAFLQPGKQLRGRPLGWETSDRWAAVPRAPRLVLALCTCCVPRPAAPHPPQWPAPSRSPGPPGGLRARLPNRRGQPWQ